MMKDASQLLYQRSPYETVAAYMQVHCTEMPDCIENCPFLLHAI